MRFLWTMIICYCVFHRHMVTNILHKKYKTHIFTLYSFVFVEQQRFRKLVDSVKHLRPKSVFSQRTEESSASQYFQFYGYLSQQQNMMQDYVRTSTYQRAILGNSIDFHVRHFYCLLIYLNY